MNDRKSISCQPISAGQNFLWLNLPHLLPLDSKKFFITCMFSYIKHPNIYVDMVCNAIVGGKYFC